jgi:hypothetical protein
MQKSVVDARSPGQIAKAIVKMNKAPSSRSVLNVWSGHPTLSHMPWCACCYEASRDARKFRRVVLSCDPAGKATARNGAVEGKSAYILHATRGHWTVMQMREQIISLAAQWNVDLVLIEDTSSGMGLIQLFKEQSRLSIVSHTPTRKPAWAHHQGRFDTPTQWGVLLGRGFARLCGWLRFGGKACAAAAVHGRVVSWGWLDGEKNAGRSKPSR